MPGSPRQCCCSGWNPEGVCAPEIELTISGITLDCTECIEHSTGTFARSGSEATFLDVNGVYTIPLSAVTNLGAICRYDFAIDTGQKTWGVDYWHYLRVFNAGICPGERTNVIESQFISGLISIRKATGQIIQLVLATPHALHLPFSHGFFRGYGFFTILTSSFNGPRIGVSIPQRWSDCGPTILPGVRQFSSFTGTVMVDLP